MEGVAAANKRDRDDDGVDAPETRYPLDVNEFEIKVQGRVGPQRSDMTAHLKNDGRVRIDDLNNPEAWIEFQLPEDYINKLHWKFWNDRESKRVRVGKDHCCDCEEDCGCSDI